MEYRPLGKTGMMVSALGYGASPLGGVFGQVNEADGIRAVHAALDLGINYIDVAPYYGLTKAETVLGKALRGIARDRYFLATKVGRYGEEVEAFNFSTARVTASVDESLARLGVEYVDVIQCHDIEFAALDQIVEETIPALRKLQTQGKVRFVGITAFPLKSFEYVADRTAVDTILSYNRYLLNDTALTDMASYFRKQGIGIINASPLGMGLFTGRELQSWHPAPDDVRRACADARAYCEQHGADIAKLAVQFSAANPDLATTLVGTANPKNIEKNVHWLEEPIDEELLAEVQAILAPIQNQTWMTGRAENN